MGNVGKNSAHISAIIPKPVAALLDERAKTLSLSRSRYASLVLDWWESQGCPAVTPADEAVQILKRGKVGRK